MVFQNYALYPHMNVFNNMSFGFKLSKTPKAEILRAGQRSGYHTGP
jgi:multiple sugar transport system ATP-binding protein